MSRSYDMKKVKLIKDESGYALIFVQILMIAAGFWLVPLMLVMTAGLISSQFHTDRMHRFYAADAGIDYGVYDVIHDVDLPVQIGTETNFALGEDINNCGVYVTIHKVEDGNYGVTSAASNNSGTTTVESSVSVAHFTLLDNAITSPGSVTIQSGTTISGDVHCSGTIDQGPNVQINGDIITDEIQDWPTVGEVSAPYWDDVLNLEPFASDTIDIGGSDIDMGPLRREGILSIINTGSLATGTLQGTVYVTGDLEIGQTNQDFWLDLNGQTIYADGNIRVGGKCTITGSGCIIAAGDVTFQPMISSSPNDFVLLMSVGGTVQLNPGGDYYGAVAGDADITIQPGNSLERTQPPAEGLNLFDIVVRTEVQMLTYAID
jgi:cytoskeletal protein CcmA (bactofilin family)